MICDVCCVIVRFSLVVCNVLWIILRIERNAGALIYDLFVERVSFDIERDETDVMNKHFGSITSLPQLGFGGCQP